MADSFSAPGSNIDITATEHAATARYTFTVTINLNGGSDAGLYTYLSTNNPVWTRSNNIFTYVGPESGKTFSCGSLDSIYTLVTKADYYFAGLDKYSVTVRPAGSATVSASYGQYSLRLHNMSTDLLKESAAGADKTVTLPSPSYTYEGVVCERKGWTKTEALKVMCGSQFSTWKGEGRTTGSYPLVSYSSVTLPKYHPSYQTTDEKAVWGGSDTLDLYAAWYQYCHVLYYGYADNWSNKSSIAVWTGTNKACDVTGLVIDSKSDNWERGFKIADSAGKVTGGWAAIHRYSEPSTIDGQWKYWWENGDGTKSDTSLANIPVSVPADSFVYLVAQYTTFKGELRCVISGEEYYSILFTGTKPEYYSTDIPTIATAGLTIGLDQCFRGWTTTSGSTSPEYMALAEIEERNRIIKSTLNPATGISALLPSAEDETVKPTYIYPIIVSRSSVATSKVYWRYYTVYQGQKVYPKVTWSLATNKTESGVESYYISSDSDYVVEWCEVKYVEDSETGIKYFDCVWASEENFDKNVVLFDKFKTYVPIAKEVESCSGKKVYNIVFDSSVESPISCKYEGDTSNGRAIYQFQGWYEMSAYNSSTTNVTVIGASDNKYGLVSTNADSPKNYIAIWWGLCSAQYQLSVSSGGSYVVTESESPSSAYCGLPSTQTVSLSKAWGAAEKAASEAGTTLQSIMYNGTAYNSGDASISVTFDTAYSLLIGPVMPVYADRPIIYLDCDTGYYAGTSFETIEITDFFVNANYGAKTTEISDEEFITLLEIPSDQQYKYAIEDITVGAGEATEVTHEKGKFSCVPTTGKSQLHLKAVLRPAKFTLVVEENGSSCEFTVTHGKEFVCVDSDLTGITIPKDKTIIGFSFSTLSEGDYAYDFPAVGETDFRRANGTYVYDGESLTVVPVWGYKPQGVFILSPTGETYNLLGKITVKARVTVEDGVKFTSANTRLGLYSGSTLLTCGSQLPAGVTQFDIIPDAGTFKTYTIKALGNTGLDTLSFSIAAKTIHFSGTCTDGSFTESMPEDINCAWFQPTISSIEINVSNRSAVTGEVGYSFAGWSEAASKVVTLPLTTEEQGVITTVVWEKPTTESIPVKTLYAMWGYSVSYRLGSGYWREGETPKANAGYATYEGAGDITYTVPYTPVHDKYALDHWVKNGSAVYEDAEGKYSVPLSLGTNILTAAWKYPEAVANIASVGYTSDPAAIVELDSSSYQYAIRLRYNFEWTVLSSDGSDMILGDGMVLNVPTGLVAEPEKTLSVVKLKYNGAVVSTGASSSAKFSKTYKVKDGVVLPDDTTETEYTIETKDNLATVEIRKKDVPGLALKVVDGVIQAGTLETEVEISAPDGYTSCKSGTRASDNEEVYIFTTYYGEVVEYDVKPKSGSTVQFTRSDNSDNVTILPVHEVIRTDEDNPTDLSATWLNVENSKTTHIDCYLTFYPYAWEVYKINTDRLSYSSFTRVSTPYLTATCDALDPNPLDTIRSVTDETRYGSIYIAARAPEGKYAVLFYYVNQSDSKIYKYYVLINVKNVVYDAPLCVVHKFVKGAAGDKDITSTYNQYDEGTYTGTTETGQLQHTLYLSSPGMTNISVTALNRSFQAQVTSIPILTKSSEYNYCIDLGTRENITFTVSRTEPKTIDNNSKDQTKWSNGVWYQHVKKFFDEWQNLNYGADGRRSGGYNLIYDPGNGYAFPVMNKNVFMSNQLSYQYNRAILDLQFSFTVATMTPKTQLSGRLAITFYTEADGVRKELYKRTTYGSTMTLPGIIDLGGGSAVVSWRISLKGSSEAWEYPAGGEFVWTGASYDDKDTELEAIGQAATVDYAILMDEPGQYVVSLKSLNEKLAGYGKTQVDTTNWSMAAYVVGGGGAGGACRRYPTKVNSDVDGITQIFIGGGGSSGVVGSKVADIQYEWLDTGYFLVTVGSGGVYQEGQKSNLSHDYYVKGDNREASASSVSYVGTTRAGFDKTLSAAGGRNGGYNSKGESAGDGSATGGEHAYYNADALSLGNGQYWTWSRWSSKEVQGNPGSSLVATGTNGTEKNNGGTYLRAEKSVSTDSTGETSTTRCAGSGGGGAGFRVDLTNTKLIVKPQMGDFQVGVKCSKDFEDKDVFYSAWCVNKVEFTQEGRSEATVYSGDDAKNFLENDLGLKVDKRKFGKTTWYVAGTPKMAGKLWVEVKTWQINRWYNVWELRYVETPYDEWCTHVSFTISRPAMVDNYPVNRLLYSQGASPPIYKQFTKAGAMYGSGSYENISENYPRTPKYGGGGASAFGVPTSYSTKGADGVVVLAFIKKSA